MAAAARREHDNVRSIPASELAGRLDDELFALNERTPGSFPKQARAYLDDWASPQSGWLRKYYPEGTDEPHFDATPAVEKALQWVRGLGQREFVGTESRLNTIFELLRQIVFGTEADPQARIEELTRRKQQLDDEIARIEAGDLSMLDSTGVRDRYQQFAATARELLADFREVEENFRKLDRQLREKIAGWHGGKGELLDDVLGSRESIAGSYQGKSFQAFYDFLLSQARQEELSGLLDGVHELTGIAESDPGLRRIHYEWLDAAERTQTTVRQLSEQLRRFEQVYVDPGPLRGGVRQALRRAPQIGLGELVAQAPLTHGLAELVTYLYVTADRALSVAGDFDEFGTDITLLRKRLRADSGIRVHDGFPEYGKDFRRRLGIESEQAMELFHQTVSMKSVGNLTDFVRDHMLEPFDAAKATANIIAHFEDLTKAHEAVQRAQAQLAALTPLLKDCDAYDAVNSEISALNAQREALKYYFAEAKAGLLDGLLNNLASERTGLTLQRDGLDDQLRGLRERETQLRVERAGHGGNRLAEIEREIDEQEKARAARMARAQRFGALLTEAGLEAVETAAQFAARRGEITAGRERASEAAGHCQQRLKDIAGDERPLREESERVGAELRSLRERKSNIPKRNLDIRRLLCQELKLTESALPFAGELITVLEHESDWEGAAERLLHGFALSILVPEEHYAPVADWINDHFLNGRVVYYRVPAMAAGSRDTGSRDARRPRPPARSATRDPLSAKLDVRDTPFAPWVEDELATRADYECVATMEEFRRTPRAITRAGQIKGSGGRHEKDDRFRIDDRSTYVLGWANERKIDALLRQATALQGRLSALTDAEARLKTELEAAIKRGQVLAGLDQTSEFAEIDWPSVVNRIARLQDEHTKLKAASAELARLDGELTSVTDAITSVDRIKSSTEGRLPIAVEQAGRGDQGADRHDQRLAGRR